MKIAKNFSRANIIGANNHAIWFHKIFDRCALLQELRIGQEVKWMVRLAFENLANFFTRADGNGGLDDNYFVPVHRPADRPNNIENRSQIGSPAGCGWCAHCNEEYK